MENGNSTVGQLKMSINHLDYSLPASLSACTETNYIKESFDVKAGEVASGKTIKRVLNTGRSFIKGPQSYLVIRGGLSAGHTYTPNVDYYEWGSASGGACNLIKSMVFRSKDGKELDRVSFANVLNALKMRWKKSQSWQRTVGSVSGLEFQVSVLGEHTPETTGAFLNSGYGWIIPCDVLSNLFAPEGDDMMPPQLASSMTIELEFSTTPEMFKKNGNASGDFVLQEVYFKLATCEMSDDISNKVAELASKEGLRYLYRAYDNVQDGNVANSASISVKRNINQVLGVMVKSRKNDDINNILKDTNTSEVVITSWNLRYGSENFPKDRIIGAEETYYQAISALNPHLHKSEAGESYGRWFGTGRIVAWDFSRSDDLPLSGVSISNSKSIEFQAEYLNATPKRVDVFVEHLRLATVSLTSTIVEY